MDKAVGNGLHSEADKGLEINKQLSKDTEDNYAEAESYEGEEFFTAEHRLDNGIVDYD